MRPSSDRANGQRPRARAQLPRRRRGRYPADQTTRRPGGRALTRLQSRPVARPHRRRARSRRSPPTSLTQYPAARPPSRRSACLTLVAALRRAALTGVACAPLFQPGIQSVAQALQLFCGCFVSGNARNIAVEGSCGRVRGFVIQLRNDADQPVDDFSEAGNALVEYGRVAGWVLHPSRFFQTRLAAVRAKWISETDPSYLAHPETALFGWPFLLPANPGAAPR